MELRKKDIKKLRKIFGDENVISEKTPLVTYGYDATIVEKLPECIVFPTDTKKTVELVNFARTLNIPLIARGAGTNLSGGSLPVENSIVVCFSKMNKIIEIDEKNFVAVVEPGVINYDLQKELDKKGFYFPPDPASLKVSTLGGNVNECAGGPRCFKYGVTRDYILGLEAILPNGKTIETGSKFFNSDYGYDFTRLLIGSEGTLSLITKINLRILPKPFSIKTMLAMFNNVEDASKTVSKIVAAGIIPTTLELMDNMLINTTDEYLHLGLPRDAGAMLLIEVDGHEIDLDTQVSENVINAFNDIKEIFDPDSLFNPGKIVDLDIVKLLN